MKTLMLSTEKQEDIALAAKLLREGKLVAIPTETVYGLGANGLDEEAVLHIFEAKGRPQDNPLILHISEPRELESICHDIPDAAWVLAGHFWPGPLTMVLPVRDCVPKRTTAGLDTVAVRCPKTSATRELIRLAGVPVAAPSANRSGKPSTTTAAHVLHDMDGRIDAILDGGACEVGVESTIVDLTGERPRLLRPGGVTPEELKALLGELDIDRAVLGQIANDAVVRASLSPAAARPPRGMSTGILRPATPCCALRKNCRFTRTATPWPTVAWIRRRRFRPDCLPRCATLTGRISA